MTKENGSPDVIEFNYGGGYSQRLHDSRNSLICTLDQTSIWQINERDGIQKTLEGINRMLLYLAELDAQQDV